MKYSMILNLTQHKATQDQIKGGVIDLPENYKILLAKLLTFDAIPDRKGIIDRCLKIHQLIVKFLTDDLSPIKNEVKEFVDIDGFININKEQEFKDAFKIGFMIGGAMFLVPQLGKELSKIGYPLFAFSKRIVEEVQKDDGSVEKKVIFRHEGFVDFVC